MNRFALACAASFAGTICVSGAAFAADAWKIDSSHSAAQFSVKHMMISNVRGEFSGVKGTVQLDHEKPETAKVDATIDVSTVNTREPQRDEHLKGKDFFDVSQFPTATFKSKKVLDVSKGHFKLLGDFTLHGVTKEVTLMVEGPSAEIKDPKGNARIGATATTTINRRDFGISYGGKMDNGGLMIGEEIPITIDIEMVKAPAAAG
jgi:polyisoprenoid-binding protein YceI